ncbi:hypothetical protein G4D61_04585 [Bacillus ginsengihumi]|uniref:Polymer-forming cytoskeletal protein n=1 Tax=Heyndrickxia ginsengihumi TaxID=363870 RepID=A0A6M0P455_9BACI|nr:hypothetical protein [Bacillus sp. (in: firmicutes)]NEY19243.1 hypothetical protein [Heyndrickxia ginsengihumi]
MVRLSSVTNQTSRRVRGFILKGRRIIISFITVMIVSMAIFNTAFAKEPKNIIHNKQTVIPKNQQLENVIVLGDDAVISGKVKTAVVVINGNLTVKKGADIRGSVFVLGGKVSQEKGAKITEHVINVNLNNETLHSLIFAGTIILTLWFMRLAVSLILIVLTVLVGVLMRKRISIDSKSVYFTPGKLILTGFMGTIALSALSIFLTVTIIAIPLVIIVFLGIFVSFIIGLVFLSREIGKEFAIVREKPEWLALFVGIVLLTALMNIPLIGGIIFLILLWYSLGLSITSIYRKLKERRKRKGNV